MSLLLPKRIPKGERPLKFIGFCANLGFEHLVIFTSKVGAQSEALLIRILSVKITMISRRKASYISVLHNSVKN